MNAIIFEVEILTQDEAKSYTDLYATARSMFPGLSEDEIARIVSLVVDTCPYCRMDNRRCQCWRDE